MSENNQLNQSDNTKPRNDNLIKKKEVVKRTSLSPQTIYRWMKDGRFPKSIPIAPRTTVWSENEINEWIEKKKQECRS